MIRHMVRYGVYMACLLLALSGATAEGADRDRLPAASSDDHIWFVIPDENDPDRYRLAVHGLPMDGPYFRQFFSMHDEPAAMAAWGRRVWLVMPPDPEADRPSRQVLHLAAEQLPVQGLYMPSPEDRFRVAPMLPAAAELAGFAGTAKGPVALLLPEPGAMGDTDPEAGDGPVDEDDVIRRPTLLRLVADRWRRMDLPPEVRADERVRLAVGGSRGGTVWLLSRDPEDRTRTVAWRRDLDDDKAQWRDVTLDLALSGVRNFTRVGRHVAAVSMEEEEQVAIRYVRPSGTLLLSRVDDLRGYWAIVGLKDGLRVIERSTREELRMREVTSVTGRVGEPAIMATQPLETRRVIHGPIMVTLMITCLVLWAVMRHADPERQALPKHLAPMPVAWRLQALAIDLLPGAVLGPLLLGRSLADVIYLPVWTADLDQAMPAVLMVAITVGHGTLMELFRGGSMGKLMFGARVVDLDGRPLGPHRVVLRNLFKAVILLIPPLGMLALLTPYQQGLGEIVTQSVVVFEPGEEQAAKPGDADGSGADDAENRAGEQKSASDRDES